jgi:hypothetical protein
MIGVSNPRLPFCENCGDEFPDECMSYIVPGLCALCAIPRIAEQDLERALDFQALSAEWFAVVETADKYAALEDLGETVQSDVDELAKCEARAARYDDEHPYEPRMAS